MQKFCAHLYFRAFLFYEKNLDDNLNDTKRRVFYSENIRSSPLTLLQLKLFACCLSEVSKQERNAVEFCGGNGERENERNKQTNKQKAAEKSTQSIVLHCRRRRRYYTRRKPNQGEYSYRTINQFFFSFFLFMIQRK